MKRFVDQLDSQLAELAAGEFAPKEPQAPRWRRWCGRRPIRVGGLAALATAGLMVSTISTATALPILETPTVDAAIPGVEESLRSAVPAQVTSAIDFRHGHAFQLPDHSTGYVVQSEDRRYTCMSVPDPAGLETFGSTCRPTDEVHERGLFLAIEGVASSPTTVVTLTSAALIVPRDGLAATLHSANRGQRRVEEHRGVIVIRTGHAGRLEWTVGRRRIVEPVPAPHVRGGPVMVTCPDGSVRTIDGISSSDQSEVNRHLRDARRLRCADARSAP